MQGASRGYRERIVGPGRRLNQSLQMARRAARNHRCVSSTRLHSRMRAPRVRPSSALRTIPQSRGLQPRSTIASRALARSAGRHFIKICALAPGACGQKRPDPWELPRSRPCPESTPSVGGKKSGIPCPVRPRAPPPEEVVGLSAGCLDRSLLGGLGFGYRLKVRIPAFCPAQLVHDRCAGPARPAVPPLTPPARTSTHFARELSSARRQAGEKIAQALRYFSCRLVTARPTRQTAIIAPRTLRSASNGHHRNSGTRDGAPHLSFESRPYSSHRCGGSR